jgi:hypothetical protein
MPVFGLHHPQGQEVVEEADIQRLGRIPRSPIRGHTAYIAQPSLQQTFVGWLASWLAGWAVLALVGWLACWFVGWDHLQASKFKEAQEIQQVDELHQAIKRQKINDAVAALEAKWDAVDSACTIPKAKKSLKKQISNDSEGYPVLRSAATQLT